MLKRIESISINVMIVLLSVHYLLITILLKEFDFLKLWKEVSIFGLLCIAAYRFYKSKKKYKLDIIEILIITFIILNIIYTFIFSRDIVAGLYMNRIYIEPVILYIIFKNLDLDEREYKSIIKVLFMTASIIAIYGVIQAIFLGHDFLKFLGYPYREFNGRLTPSYYLSGLGNFQRVSGTFVSPNIYSFYASTVAIILYSNLKIIKKIKFYQVGFVAILVSILLTFSRSSILGLGVVILYVIFTSKEKKKLIKLLVGVSLSALVTIFLISKFSDVNLIEKFTHLIKSTITLEDTSAVSHLDSFKKSVELIKENPMGLGLGNNGPKGLVFSSKSNLTESSYFLMAFDFGIIGCILYYLIWGILFYKSYKVCKDKKQNYGVSYCVKLLTIFSLVAFIFLPYIHDMEIICFYFIFAGIANNKSKYIIGE